MPPLMPLSKSELSDRTNPAIGITDQRLSSTVLGSTYSSSAWAKPGPAIPSDSNAVAAIAVPFFQIDKHCIALPPMEGPALLVLLITGPQARAD